MVDYLEVDFSSTKTINAYEKYENTMVNLAMTLPKTAGGANPYNWFVYGRQKNF